MAKQFFSLAPSKFPIPKVLVLSQCMINDITLKASLLIWALLRPEAKSGSQHYHYITTFLVGTNPSRLCQPVCIVVYLDSAMHYAYPITIQLFIVPVSLPIPRPTTYN